MDKNEELRRYMKEARKEFDDRLGRHPSEEELMAYERGELGESERARVQSHLVQCDACVRVLKDIGDLLASPREELAREVDIGQEWQSFQRRVEREEMEADTPGRTSPGSGLGPRLALAFAASLLLALGLTGTWALRLRQENQQLDQQWQAKQNSLEERLSRLEQDNHRLQGQTGTLKQTYESQLAELRQPRLNTPIYDILPRGSARAGNQSTVAKIQVPPTARSFTLVLNGESQPKYPGYAIEISSEGGQLVWRGEGLERLGDGNFAVTLDQTFLREGKYHLRLYGQAGGSAKEIAEYIVELK